MPAMDYSATEGALAGWVAPEVRPRPAAAHGTSRQRLDAGR